MRAFKLLKNLLGGLVGIVVVAGSQAAPVTWDLSGVTTVGTSQFHLGVLGSLTGSFDYDAATNSYSNILIRNTPNTLDPTPLTFSTFVSGDSDTLFLHNGAPDPDGPIGRFTLLLEFVGALTDLGGTVDIASGQATYFSGIRTASVTGGSVVADPVSNVPEPGSYALVALALGALALRPRRSGRARTGDI